MGTRARRSENAFCTDRHPMSKSQQFHFSLFDFSLSNLVLSFNFSLSALVFNFNFGLSNLVLSFNGPFSRSCSNNVIRFIRPVRT